MAVSLPGRVDTVSMVRMAASRQRIGIMNLKCIDTIRLGGYKGLMETATLIFKALSEEPRLRILNLLLTRGELCVCDIMASLELPQSTASRHLAYLKKTGWVDDRREGVWIHYSISKSTNALRQELAPLLKRHLAASGVTVDDQRRLEEFCKRNTCA